MVGVPYISPRRREHNGCWAADKGHPDKYESVLRLDREMKQEQQLLRWRFSNIDLEREPLELLSLEEDSWKKKLHR